MKFLEYINSIPVKFTAKHYQIFGESTEHLKNNELNSSESWNILRQNHPFFSISGDREEWIRVSENIVKKDGQDGSLVQRAKDIVEVLKNNNIRNIFSAGVGGAGLEYQIKKNIPEVGLVCSEYTKLNVEALQKVFIEANDIVLFDILNGDWKNVNLKYLESGGVLIMYRLDAGFTNLEWRKIFKAVSDSGIERVLYIPTACLTMRSLYNRKYRELKWFVTGTKISFAGYIRTQKTFESYWNNFYKQEELNFGGLKGFFLKKD